MTLPLLPVVAEAAPELFNADDPQAKAILDASREAVMKVQSLSYKGAAYGDGALSEQTPRHAAMITMTRAEAGGWKMLVVGGMSAIKAAEGSPPASEYHVGYDGASVWSLREKEKAVVERSATKTAEIERFFRAHGPWPVVAWDLVAETPFEIGKSDIRFGGERTIANIACDVVRVGKADDDEAAKGSGSASAAYVRYFIARSDKLPRRIERIRETTDKDGKVETSIRVLELNELKTDSAVTQVPFAISVPEGFKVRVDRSDRPSPEPTRERTRAENPLLRGPAADDKGEKKDNAGQHKSDPSLLAVGSVAPAWTLKDPEGNEHSLSDYRGKVVVMDFWGTWCGWCVKAMPQIQAVHEKYKDKPVVVLGINNEHDKRADPKKFMEDKKFTYGLLLKAETIAPKYKVRGWPTLYVIDPEGKVAFAESGFSPELEKILSEQIDKALTKTRK